MAPWARIERAAYPLGGVRSRLGATPYSDKYTILPLRLHVYFLSKFIVQSYPCVTPKRKRD